MKPGTGMGAEAEVYVRAWENRRRRGGLQLGWKGEGLWLA